VVLINSIKLEDKVQPTLLSLSQFSPININLSKLYDYSQHLLKLMSMFSQRKNLFNFRLGSHNVKNLKSKENDNWKWGFMFSPPFSKDLMPSHQFDTS
jgi:hypothetical protein